MIHGASSLNAEIQGSNLCSTIKLNCIKFYYQSRQVQIMKVNDVNVRRLIYSAMLHDTSSRSALAGMVRA